MPAFTSIALAVAATAAVAQTAHAFLSKPGGGGGAPSALPAPPSANDDAVKAKLEEERRQRGASGRASTLLADSSLGVGSDISTSNANANKGYLGAGV